MAKFDVSQMNFLIVDDMDNMRRSIRAMLKLIQFGHGYYEAANGIEAWKLITNDEIHLDFIIADWFMPRMNGIELLSKVRSSKNYRDLPFLIITAESNQTVIAEAAEYDVDAYLTKPFVTATLEHKIKELLEAIRNPSPMKRLLTKARELREKGKLSQAVICAKEAARQNSHSSRPLRELGLLYLRLGDLDKSKQSFEQATVLNRLDVPSYHYLGEIYLRQGDIDRAIGSYSMAVRLSPRHTKRAFAFAKLLTGRGKFSEAEEVFKIILKNNASDLELQEEIAEACYEEGVAELAVKTFQKILRNDPQRWYLQKKIALALQKAKRSKEAVAAFETALQRTPEDLDLLLGLAQAYLDLGLPIRADKWANKAIRLDENNQTAKEILDKCL